MEFGCPPNKVFDRKSVRRRMARDIYFVFEECKKKCSKIRGSFKSKSKFSHLKVGEVHKNCTYNPKNILYSVKKGNCFVNANSVNQKAYNQTNGSQIQFPVSNIPIAKVNPIFVWVKQDNTTIVEVRCEDYDKRNRIRLTKTLNGWQATPRTDPSSSRTVKLVPKNLQKVTFETQSADHKKKDKKRLFIRKHKHSYNSKDLVQNIKRIKNDIINKEIGTALASNESISNQSDDRLYSSNNNTHFSKDFNYKLTMKVTAENADSTNIDNSIENNKLQTSISEHDTPELQLCAATGLFIPKIMEEFGEELFKINHLIGSKDSDIIHFKAQIEKSQKDEIENFTDLLDESNLNQNCSNNNGSEKINSLDNNNFLGYNCSNDASSGSELINSLVKNTCDNNLIHCHDKERDDLNKISKTFLQQGSVSKILSHLKKSITDLPDCSYLSKTDEIQGLNVDTFQNEVSECPNGDKACEIKDLNVHLLQNGVQEWPTLKGLNVDLFRHGIVECHNFSGARVVKDLDVDMLQAGSFINIDTNEEIVKKTQFATNILPDHKKYQIASNVSLRSFTQDSPEDLSYRKLEEVCSFSELPKKYPIMSSNVLKSYKNSTHSFEPTSETNANIFKDFSKLTPFNSLRTHQTEKNKESNCNDFCSNCFDTISEDIHVEEPIQKLVCESANSHESKNKFKINMQNDPDPLTQLKILIHNCQWKLPDPILVPRERLGAILASPAREIPMLLTTCPELTLPEAFSHPEILKNPNILVISIAQLEAILRMEMELKIQSKEPANVFTLPFSTNHYEEKTQNILERTENYDFSNYNKSDSMNCSQTGTCFESDLNTARLAILNRMLLLPYSYAQMSSDVLQMIKGEAVGQKNFSNSCFLSLYNQQFPKATKNEAYDKNINIPINLKQNEYISERLDNPNRKREVLPSIELPMLEELLQSKMQRLHSINKIISEIDENIIASSNKPCLKQKTFAVLTSHKDFKIIQESIIKNNSLSNVRSSFNFTDKSFVNSINNNVDLSNITFYKNLREHQKNIEYKPKLTCKSLSNLIYPENITHTTVPLVNLITSNNKYFCKYGDIEHENILNHIERYSSPLSDSTNCTHNSVNGVTTEKTDSNAALWHPLFGSNKNGYCSPWQWTTITSPGE